MLIKKVRTTKNTHSFKQNITWQLLIIIQFDIALTDLKEGDSEQIAATTREL